MNTSLNKVLENIKWGEFEIGELFEIKSTKSFNKDLLVKGNDYDYVTRTSLNQGIHSVTGFINSENINEKNTWSLGLMQMDFFYRKRKWYAGQFVRKIIPKFELNEYRVNFFSAVLNKQSQNLLSVLVRDIDKTFLNTKIKLPIYEDGSINFSFMEKFIAELEATHVAELDAYLEVTGLKDYELTIDEKELFDKFINTLYSKTDRQTSDKYVCLKEFEIGELFEKLNLRFKKKKFDKNLDVSKEKNKEFDLPLVNAKNGNNGIMYYGRSSDFESAEMCIDIVNDGAISTGNVYAQPQKTGVLYNAYLITSKKMFNKEILLYFVTSIQKTIKLKYGYENKAGWEKIKNDKIKLPIKNNKIDYDFMNSIIIIIQKLVIKDLVIWNGKKLKTYKKVINN